MTKDKSFALKEKKKKSKKSKQKYKKKLTKFKETQKQISIRKAGIRSEERRVGKECRTRWSPYH